MKNPNPTQTTPNSQQRLTRKRTDSIRISQLSRIYNHAEDKFTYNISYQTHTKPTPRSIQVAEAFGLGIDETQEFKILETQLTLKPNDIVYITGDSGSGKSVLLRALRSDLGDQAIDLSEVQIEPDKPIIETIGKTLEEALELLSKLGLNDAFLFLRTYNQLSDGQKYRYRIAKLIESQKQWWIMDEFAACLDRDTAKIIAYNLQKTARQHKKAAITATTHNDLFEDLNPSVHIHKRYGSEIQTTYHPNQPAQACSLTKEMTIEPANKTDWQTLAKFHYRNHQTAVPRKIYRLTRNGELCGIIVYSYPPPACYGRRLMLPKMPMQELNKQLSIINRVVIHPKYRTIGLGEKIIQETLQLAGTPNVEMIAVMAKYNTFAEKAGMKKITHQQPNDSFTELLATLTNLGFDAKLLGSQKHVLQKLQSLTAEQTLSLKAAFAKNKHPRLKKELSGTKKLPYGLTSNYLTKLKAADSQKMAKLIKLVGMLMQTKIYLFWTNNPKTT
jgi:ABC-type transport system involved in cytochrome c biogenesis ATPase subunit